MNPPQKWRNALCLLDLTLVAVSADRLDGRRGSDDGNAALRLDNSPSLTKTAEHTAITAAITLRWYPWRYVYTSNVQRRTNATYGTLVAAARLSGDAARNLALLMRKHHLVLNTVSYIRARTIVYSMPAVRALGRVTNGLNFHSQILTCHGQLPCRLVLGLKSIPATPEAA
jgi:hypothetical protein